MTDQLRHRWIMAGLGAAAGLSIWALAEVVEADWLTGRWAIFICTLTAGFFAALLALAGQMRWGQALTGALLAALPPAALLTWVSLRHDDPYDLFDQGFGFLAAFVLGLIPLPFLLARASGPHWRDYGALFNHAWGLTIRALAALVFVGVVWVLVFLSDALLSLVGITLIEELLREEAVGFVLTGTAIGLSLAVISDLGDYVSPDLLIRLLRLLAPLVLLVTAVFLLALPVKGLSNLFGGLSAAGVLLAMAAVGAAMVSMAIDRADDQAAASPVIRQSARGLAVCVLLLAGFGAWAVWLRVGQYGLSPERVLALLAAVVALGYGLGYAVSVARGAAWMQGIRQTNVWMALGMGAMAALTLTPVLDAERLSANSQMRRAIALAEQGEVADLRALNRWGRAGAAALTALEGQAKALALPKLAEATGAARSEGTTISYGPTPEMKAELKAILPAQPARSGAMRDGLVAWMDDYQVMALHEACTTPLPGGTPGCVAMFYDALPEEPGEEALLLYRGKSGDLRVEGYGTTDDGATWVWQSLQIDGPQMWERAVGEALIAQLQAGEPKLRPVTLQALVVGQNEILFVPQN
ncbi:DUF4153 domain-containing protein [Neogemmobacter tilapiae]|uniref:DUF4153 domain-containing protein n=1 Tax=Neogemmobacter tilapiae TaxID=875041 RepID=UPI001E51A6EC|nr:DUF4153 domain-containing protein [Gemmobacter tilapiae]